MLPLLESSYNGTSLTHNHQRQIYIFCSVEGSGVSASGIDVLDNYSWEFEPCLKTPYEFCSLLAPLMQVFIKIDCCCLRRNIDLIHLNCGRNTGNTGKIIKLIIYVTLL